jgi:hypothetical protein
MQVNNAVSPHFFAKEWPQKELDGLSAREIQSVKVILPVWHNVTYDDVLKFSPKLADRLAVRTDKGLAEVVRQLLRACPKPKQPEPERPAQPEQPKPKQPAKKQSVQQPPATQPSVQKTTPKANGIRLRSKPLMVSLEKASQVFELTEHKFDRGTGWVPRTYITNQYENREKVIFDHATGLMWQKSGSDWIAYKAAQAYIKKLNDQKFAGYTGWRLPTIPELMSLLEPEQQSNNLYINPIFDSTQSWCWSADLVAGLAELAWRVYFNSGVVYWDLFISLNCVREVRS